MTVEKESVYKFRKYYPVRNPQKANNSFDFLISNDESVIYKRNNNSSEIFSELMKDKKTFEDFENILSGSLFTPEMSSHICKGFDLELDGSYKMKFLHGYRLDMLESYELDSSMINLIIKQIEILLNSLAKANEANDFFGDWAAHNLVYSFEFSSIFNIDLEGFLMYRPLPEWADYNTVEEWLKSIITDLHASLSVIE